MTEPARRRCGFIVHGRVQGVGFRWWTRDAATRLGLGGHVRNLPDGTVEVHVSGTPEQVTGFERALWHGPPPAHVERVVVTSWDARARDDRFEMERW